MYAQFTKIVFKVYERLSLEFIHVCVEVLRESIFRVYIVRKKR